MEEPPNYDGVLTADVVRNFIPVDKKLSFDEALKNINTRIINAKERGKESTLYEKAKAGDDVFEELQKRGFRLVDKERFFRIYW
jgi:hypothetical protein